MWRRCVPLALAIFLLSPLLVAGRRNTVWRSIPFTASQTTTVLRPPGLANPPTITLNASGAGNAQVKTNGVFRLPARKISGSVQYGNITAGGGQPVRSITVTGSNAAGSFLGNAGSGGGFGGAMRMLAEAVVHLNVGFASGVQTIPLSAIGQTAVHTFVGKVPLATAMGAIVEVPGTYTVEGKKWTVGMVTATATNTAGGGMMFTSSVMDTGFDNRTANELGTIQLVTPIVIRTALTGEQVGISTLTITFGQQASATSQVGRASLAVGLLALMPALWAARRAR